MAISKVIYGNNVLIDLTNDTVVSNGLLAPFTAHTANGEQIVGTCTYDADTSDATATSSDLKSGTTAYVNGIKITGTLTWSVNNTTLIIPGQVNDTTLTL